MGGHDQPCSALGVGAIGSGRVADSMGTYECLLAASDQPCLTDEALALLSTLIVTWFQTSSLRWHTSHQESWLSGSTIFCTQQRMVKARSLKTGIHRTRTIHYASLEREAPAGPTGLCITPNLIGTCNPDFNPRARGIISRPGTEHNPRPDLQGHSRGTRL